MSVENVGVSLKFERIYLQLQKVNLHKKRQPDDSREKNEKKSHAGLNSRARVHTNAPAQNDH